MIYRKIRVYDTSNLPESKNQYKFLRPRHIVQLVDLITSFYSNSCTTLSTFRSCTYCPLLELGITIVQRRAAHEYIWLEYNVKYLHRHTPIRIMNGSHVPSADLHVMGERNQIKSHFSCSSCEKSTDSRLCREF